MILFEKGNLKIHRLLLNNIRTNCFIIQKNNQALLIDPVDNPDDIINYLNENELRLRAMVSTHAHFDHVFGAAGMIESGLVESLYLHEKDFEELKKAKTFSAVIYKKILTLPQVKMFDEEFAHILQEFNLGITHAGGHTRGSCYLYDLDKRYLVTGDLALNHKLKISLFDKRENNQEFFDFIKNVKSQFGQQAMIFPGHGELTYLGVELENNQKWKYIIERNKRDESNYKN